MNAFIKWVDELWFLHGCLKTVIHMFVLMTVHCTISQEHMSTENINEILDKLILQTKPINESGSIVDTKDITPVIDIPPGNDSNIYYFKTYMAPHINFKTSSETLHASLHSNKTVQSDEVSNQDHDPNSEDESFPGASKITRKSFIGVEHHKKFTPRFLHGGQESVYAEYKARSGHIDENNYSLENLIKNEIVSELSTTNDKKQISFTQSGHQNQQLNILHDYPEIIIDHVTYDNNETDKNNIVKIKSTHDAQHMQSEVKGEPNNKVQNLSPRNIRYNIPEEEIEAADHDPPEFLGSRNYLTPEMKGLIDAIIQKKVMHDALLKQTTESESRKQSMLLEKILQRLPEKRQMSNNIKSSYSLHHERITPAEMETLSHLRSSLETSHRSGGNLLKKSYLNVPFVPSKWEIHNRLLRTLMRMCRPEGLKRTRLVAGLIGRMVPNIDYRPVYYDVYK